MDEWTNLLLINPLDFRYLLARVAGGQMHHSSQPVGHFSCPGCRTLRVEHHDPPQSKLRHGNLGGQDLANMFNCRQGDIAVNSRKCLADVKGFAMAIEVAMVVRGKSGIYLEFAGEQAAGQGTPARTPTCFSLAQVKNRSAGRSRKQLKIICTVCTFEHSIALSASSTFSTLMP